MGHPQKHVLGLGHWASKMLEGVAKLQVTTSKRSKGSKSRIISNTMQEPQRGSQLGDRQ